MNATPNSFRRNWAGLMVPAILALALLADGLSRFLSLDHFTIRAWEAMTRNAFTEGGVPLEPSKHFEKDRSYGDLAAMSNRPELREYHREVFTTDRFGYRNPDTFSRANPPDALLIGTSFSVGCGVSDDQNLAVRLGARTGQRVYNGAGSPPSPEQANAIAGRFGMKKGTVFYEQLEPIGFPSPPPPISRVKQICYDRLGETCLRLKGWLSISPVEILSRRAYHWLEDDVWLPNALGAGWEPVPVDGGPMLFSESGITPCPGVTSEHARDYFRWFRDKLEGLDLFVILAPSKFMVYGSLTDANRDRPAETTNANAAQSCFATMGRALDELGIPYVNLTEPLHQAARDALARRRLIYFRGDTHWNAAGIDIAAGVIGDAWSSSRHRAVGRDP
jgi:hypothetical protein